MYCTLLLLHTLEHIDQAQFIIAIVYTSDRRGVEISVAGSIMLEIIVFSPVSLQLILSIIAEFYREKANVSRCFLEKTIGYKYIVKYIL